MPLNYEKDTKIEESALDVEWLQQPMLAVKYGQHAAQMRKRAKEAAQRVKILQSELIRDTNQDPRGTTGKDKPTVSDVEAYYRSQDAHKQAIQDQIDAEYEADYADYARGEISFSRKQALENLVVLHGQQYFAGPKMPRDLSNEWKKRQEKDREISASIGSSLNRKRTINKES